MKNLVNIPGTNIEIYPLVLGGNTFGWSSNKEESFAVLDAFYEAGGNFIDSADLYSEWKPGNIGGESESIIGEWMETRKNRSEIIVATKVAKYSRRLGLSPININAAIDDSLKRLRTDYVDIYYAHEDDKTVPLVDTMIAFSQLITMGKVKYIAASNYSAERLNESLQISQKNSLAKYIGIQNEYNIVVRKNYENGISNLVKNNSLASFPYFSLAMGFLTGKYRESNQVDSVRAEGVSQYLTPQGFELINQLEKIANNHQASISAVSLAWLRQQESVTAPIASARTVDQLKEIMQLVELSEQEINLISNLSKSGA